ncbi:MAG: SusE domain-containing protein [Bacteroidales bacterium]|nr:SusE domain-containing protein [Bacteroidales bacterium]
MKHIVKSALLLAAAAACLWSCEIQFDKQQLADKGQFVAANLKAPGDVNIQESSLGDDVTFEWTAANFGAPTQIQYSVYVANGDKKGLVGVTYDTKLSLTQEDLNGILLNDLGLDPSESNQITSYVEAEVYSVYGSLSGDPIVSNTVSFNVTPYLPPLTCVYLPGVAGKWNFGCVAWETAPGSQTYTSIVNLDGSATFKVTDAPDWNHGNWGREYFTGKCTGVEAGSGDIRVSSMDNPIKVITVQPARKRVNVTEPYTAFSAIGTISGTSWNQDFDFTYDRANDVWKTSRIDFTAGSEYKIRCNHGWSESYGGGTKGSNYVSGGFEIEGGNNIKPGIEGTYVIELHLNRTPWVVVYVKQ